MCVCVCESERERERERDRETERAERQREGAERERRESVCVERERERERESEGERVRERGGGREREQCLFMCARERDTIRTSDGGTEEGAKRECVCPSVSPPCTSAGSVRPVGRPAGRLDTDDTGRRHQLQRS